MAHASAETGPRLIELAAIDDDRLGAPLPLWFAFALLGVGLLGWGLRLAPSLQGWLLVIPGGVLAGLAYAQIVLRLPTLTRSGVGSVFALVVCSAALLGVLTMAGVEPAPQPIPDVLISGNRAR
jgi:hypothetical protein